MCANTTGAANTALGANALIANTIGICNTAVGVNSLRANTTGVQNTAVGDRSLYSVTTGTLNTTIGSLAGCAITTGVCNTVVGANVTLAAGTNNNVVLADGGGNVRFHWNGTLNMITGSVGISGSLAVGGIPPSATVGRIDASNDVVAFSTSDKNLKTNLTPISDALYKIAEITGYEFDWIPNAEIHGYEGHDVGIIAQEIEKVLPEVVTTRSNGYKAVKYEKIVPLLIQAIKEQSEQIKKLEEYVKSKLE